MTKFAVVFSMFLLAVSTVTEARATETTDAFVQCFNAGKKEPIFEGPIQYNPADLSVIKGGITTLKGTKLRIPSFNYSSECKDGLKPAIQENPLILMCSGMVINVVPEGLCIGAEVNLAK